MQGAVDTRRPPSVGRFRLLLLAATVPTCASGRPQGDLLQWKPTAFSIPFPAPIIPFFLNL